MIFDFFRLEKKLNKVDGNVSKTIASLVSNMKDITKSNNALQTMGAECSMKKEHYSSVHESIQGKVEANNQIIAKIKEIIS
ncbi:hypothetical protein [Clostridium tagluense]|uniref:Uncharacterized protein n=1 Tax=Clostridium tagluense TaxID=360422 RepID=A0A401ULL7_9CLOT|nr:hypothetical protein [Clostridium tagluense]GCD10420.1 hypothetical protein Ctaglu_20430 [Clostridium tagluense]